MTFDLRAGLFLASALTAVPCAAQDRAVPCQLVLHNGNIATMDARNTVDAPEAIYPVKISATKKGDALVLRLPPKSVSVLRLQ